MLPESCIHISLQVVRISLQVLHISLHVVRILTCRRYTY